ncbi:uncharacterized protein GGS25DRAFT_473835, partial [Hypoxylon fragiforme]|uniref:uncharacterized protein n=1 Tax=Hypoxylon fragiforme TaxID=63214 RepID=UPI0020C5F1F6
MMCRLQLLVAMMRFGLAERCRDRVGLMCLLAASSHLSSLALEAANSLLSPLGSHLGDF